MGNTVGKGVVELAVLAVMRGRDLRLSHRGRASEVGRPGLHGEHGVPGVDALAVMGSWRSGWRRLPPALRAATMVSQRTVNDTSA